MKFQYLLFVVYLLVAITGQILQKVGMNQVGTINNISLLFSKDTFYKIVSTPVVWLGLLLSVSSFMMWMILLSNFKISYIYALSSITYIIIAIASYLFLGERLAWNQWVGTIVIASGCFLLSVKL